MQPELPDYDLIAAAVDACHPSELHGQLCGLLCLDGALDEQRWLALVSIDEDALRDRGGLSHLYRATVAQIEDDDYRLQLLLPDEDMNLSVRADSLAFWCQGLLTGLGLGAMPEPQRLSSDSREFLDDVSQISRLGLDGDGAAEDDEIAYAEIVEYLRMGVLLLNRELRDHRHGRADARQLH